MKPTRFTGPALGKSCKVVLNGSALFGLGLGESHMDNDAATAVKGSSRFVAQHTPPVGAICADATVNRIRAILKD